MEKQELIKKIDLQTFAYPDEPPEGFEPTIAYKKGFNSCAEVVINLIEQLDEPTHDKCYEKMADYEKQISDLERQIEEMEDRKPQKVKVPACVAEYIEAHRKWGPEIFIGDWLADNDAVYKWLYNNSEKENNSRFLIAVKAFVEGYEVEEEPKWVVKSNRLYFTGITQLIARAPITYNFTTDENRAHVFDDKESAEKEASFFDGTVEKVEE